jgi:hypothetical protein
MIKNEAENNTTFTLIVGRQMRSIFPASAHNLAPGRPISEDPLCVSERCSRYVVTGISRRSFLPVKKDLISCYFNRINQNSIEAASHTRTTGKRDPATRTALFDICQ